MQSTPETAEGWPATLFISPVEPDSRSGGPGRRAFQWLIELAQHGEVHLIVVSPSNSGEISREVLNLVSSYRCFTKTVPKKRWCGKVAIALFPVLALWHRARIQDWVTSASIDAELQQDVYIGELKIARVIVFRIFMHDIAQSVVKTLSRTPIMELDLDDIESTNRFGLARLAIRRLRFRQAFKYLLGGLQYRIIESRLPQKYARIYLAAGEDARQLGAVNPKKLVVRPNKLSGETRPLARVQRVTGNFTLLFVGSLGYFPNEDAVLWLKEELGPALMKTTCPKFRIVVAGRGASDSLRSALRSVSYMDFRGEIDDLAPVYSEADACVAPIRAGSGTKFKLLEAFLYERPIVATREAARGIGALDEVHYLAAEDPKTFAAACCRLAFDQPLGQTLAAQGRQLLADRFLLPRTIPACVPRGETA